MPGVLMLGDRSGEADRGLHQRSVATGCGPDAAARRAVAAVKQPDRDEAVTEVGVADRMRTFMYRGGQPLGFVGALGQGSSPPRESTIWLPTTAVESF
jgi:hypothetical protein